MIKVLCVESDQAREIPVAELANLAQRPHLSMWVDLLKPVPEEFDLIKAIFGIHDLTIEDCQEYSQRPKIEEFPQYLFIVLHALKMDGDGSRLELPQVDLMVGKSFVITVRYEAIPPIDKHWEKYLAGSVPDYRPDRVVYAIIDGIVEDYRPVIHYWDEQVERIEESLFSHKRRNLSQQILFVRRNLHLVRRILLTQREVAARLRMPEVPFINSRMSAYFSDIYDAMLQFQDAIEANRETLTNLFEANLAMISNRMNEVMQRLTAVSTIFLPLTFITGIYGMNFKYMPELQSPYGYFAVLLILATVGFGMFTYFRNRGWLN